MYLPNNFPINYNSGSKNQGASVSQIAGYHPDCPQPQRSIAMLRIRQGGFFWWLRDCGSIGKVYPPFTKAIRGKWLHWMVHCKLTDKSDGFFTCYLNGKVAFKKRGSSWHKCENGPYFKMGTYANTPSNAYMFGDEIRIGRTREDVDPSKYCGRTTPVIQNGLQLSLDGSSKIPRPLHAVVDGFGIRLGESMNDAAQAPSLIPVSNLQGRVRLWHPCFTQKAGNIAIPFPETD